MTLVVSDSHKSEHMELGLLICRSGACVIVFWYTYLYHNNFIYIMSAEQVAPCCSEEAPYSCPVSTRVHCLPQEDTLRVPKGHSARITNILLHAKAAKQQDWNYLETATSVMTTRAAGTAGPSVVAITTIQPASYTGLHRQTADRTSGIRRVGLFAASQPVRVDRGHRLVLLLVLG